MFNSMNFDNCLYPCNHIPKTRYKIFPSTQLPHAPFQSIPTLSPPLPHQHTKKLLTLISITDQFSYS